MKLKSKDENFPTFSPMPTQGNNKEEAIRRIHIVCEYKNYEFLGFYNKEGNACDWYGKETYLMLKCRKCQNIWKTTRYGSFMQGSGCSACRDIKRSQQLAMSEEDVMKTIEYECKQRNYTFIAFSNEENKYKNIKTKLILKCNRCDKTWDNTTYRDFIYEHYGCPNCRGFRVSERSKLSDEIVIENILKECEQKNCSFEGFNNKENIYKGKNTKLILKCNKCGTIWNSTTYENFIYAHSGCPKCKNEFIRETLRLDEKIAMRNILNECSKQNYTFIGFANKENKYQRYDTKLILKCNKCGTIWNSTNYSSFVHNHRGCSKCKSSSIENEIENLLIQNNFNYNIHDRKTLDGLELDFYIPSKKIAIECQGIQHFETVEYFGGIEGYEKCIKHDKEKAILCEQKGIKLLYYSNLGIEYPYQVYENKEELLNEIKKTH